ncbi:hypothetical protein JKP88DRAFT_309120, partial [Tribonema minus]
MQDWAATIICPGQYRPRQFEYHPYRENVLVFGTLKGEAVVANTNNEVLSEISTGLSKSKHDSILGLCWLRRHPALYVVGS